MIDFNQYAAKRFLAGYVSIALDELGEGRTVYYADMKRLLGGRYPAYDRDAKADLTVAVSERAKEWDQKRTDLVRRIGFALNRKQLTDGIGRDAKEVERRRQFNIEAEGLLESYRESIEGTPDEAGFIIYEGSFEAPWDEPYMAAQEVIEEFRLPRLKRPGEFGEESYHQETQRRHLQELLDELEGRIAEPSEAPDRASPVALLRKLNKYFN